MLIAEDRDEVAALRIEHGRVGALDVELLDSLTEAVTAGAAHSHGDRAQHPGSSRVAPLLSAVTMGRGRGRA
ncbi:hypothetical protein [Geodermatophilus sabuli]|uniref:Uncharacterized protein n=1 Tax=Geodermatophilus sabuli TaxID=1564158 RepID=A0A285EDI5_9ACTN|nr:hypothetical protein [Geodermatophilus sabuli]MBB3084604.1 hypothetical protein [Geodermatophilus sabuli]SNX97202.1 hypothetical protein SAMN06893097_106152 [Geodermatophilus sabuli]